MSSADVSHDAFLQKKTFGALDGLRALSILATMGRLEMNCGTTTGRSSPDYAP